MAYSVVAMSYLENLTLPAMNYLGLSGEHQLPICVGVHFWELDSIPSDLCMSLHQLGFPGGSEVKASASNAGDPGLIPRLGISPGEGNGNPPQYSCLENPMVGRAW